MPKRLTKERHQELTEVLATWKGSVYCVESQTLAILLAGYRHLCECGGMFEPALIRFGSSKAAPEPAEQCSKCKNSKRVTSRAVTAAKDPLLGPGDT
jgi:hypothetical protein